MSVFIIAIILVALVFSLKRPSYGFGLFVAVRILIPEIVRTPGLEVLSLNSTLIMIVGLSAFMKNFKSMWRTVWKDKFVKFLLFFIAYSIITLPLAEYENLEGQFGGVRQFFFTDILPIIIGCTTITSKKDFEIVVTVFLGATSLCCLYGILEFLMGANPYVLSIKLMYRYKDLISANDVSTDFGGRGFGSSGTFVHANGYGYFISMSIPLCLYLIQKNYKRKMALLTLLLLIVNMFLCKKRSPLVTMAAFFGLWMLLNKEKDKWRNNAKILGIALMGLLCIEIIPYFENLRNMVNTSLIFWDDKMLAHSDVGGSNMELRIRQVFYPFVEVANNPLFGHGANWSGWYLSEYELHPVLYGFETLFSSAVCDYGVIGYILYYLLFKKAYRYSHPFKSSGTNFQLLNVFAVAILAIATGFNYFYFFGFVVVLMSKYEKLFYVRNV